MPQPRRNATPARRTSGDPFGNLGKTDWGMPTLMALVVYSGLYGLAKFGGQWCPFPMDVILQLLAVVVAASAAETVYSTMTSGLRTSGFHRFFMCFTGALVPAFLVRLALSLFFGEADGVLVPVLAAGLAAVVSALVSSVFGMFWLGVLDRMKGEVF